MESPEGAALLHRARDAVAAKHRGETDAALAAAGEAPVRGDTEATERALGGLRRESLSDHAAQLRRNLERAVAWAHEVRRLVEKAKSLMSGPDPLAGRQAVDAVLDIAGDEAPSSLGRCRADLNERVRREFRVIVTETAELELDLADVEPRAMTWKTGALVVPDEPLAIVVQS